MLVEIDVFVRDRYLSTDCIDLYDYEKIKEDIQQVYGYKKDSISFLVYPEDTSSRVEILEVSINGRKYRDAKGIIRTMIGERL